MMQTGEIIIIALLALVVLGPTRLPGMARKIGGWISELRSAAREITAGLEAEVADIKGVGEDLKRPLDEVKKPFTDIRDQVSDVGKSYQWKGPKPLSGPTPEDAMRDYEELHGSSPSEESPVGSAGTSSSGGRNTSAPSEPDDDSARPGSAGDESDE